MVSTPATVTARHDAQDRLLSYGGTTYTYTENGELRTKSESGRTTTYSYDALGNLRLVALPDGRTIEYLVDARGRRVGKKIDGVLVQVLVYRSQLAPVAEFNGNGKLVARFVYGTKVNVPEYMVRDGKTYRIISDHLGSPRIVVDTTSGDVVQRIDYDEWGVVVLDTNPGFTPFGFGGGILDLDTRLTRLGARDYDGAIGRWVAKDPIRLAGGANLYVYGMNSPISFNDLSGLCPKKSLLEVGDVMSDRGGIDAVKVGTRAASALLKALELVGFLGSLEFQVAKYSLKALVPAILAAAGTVTGSTDPATNAVGAIRLGPGGIAAVTASIGQNAAARLAPNAIGIVQGGALGTAAVAVAPVSPLIPLVDSVRAASRNAAPTISSLLLGRDPVR
jgi:RHS repeat-associated protein